MKTGAGFTLIEVLVAMVVLTVGLLGLAGLQATSLKNSQNAYYRSVATQLAYDMADRMRANFTEARKTVRTEQCMTDEKGINLTPAQQAACYANRNVYISMQPNQAASKSIACEPTETYDGTCSSAYMAENDLFEWYQVIQGSLPGGSTGTITLAGNMFTITVEWAENRYSNGENVSGTTRFQTSFQL
jgi:type IV pilus assembly protein PilV